MTFEVEGGEDFDPQRLPKAVKSSLEVLTKLRDGKLLRRASLANRVGIATASIDAHTTHPALREFKFQAQGRIVYFGNKKTIQAAREQFSL
jgi:hypothetical protein